MIRVLIADDHSVVRNGLQKLLESADDIVVVATAGDGREAVEAGARERPDVVLMDLDMPTVDGIEATRRLAAEVEETSVVVLTSFSDRDRILAALDAGAVGYLLKDAEPDDLIKGVRAAARGESPLAPKAARTVLSARTARNAVPELTEREREVLSLVTEGLANKQIARRLAISEKTVKAHLTNIFQRIGVTDRTQAALWCQRNGLTRA